MCECKDCLKSNICSKAKNIENYKMKSGCSDFVHRECYELLHGLSPEQVKELMRFADSLRGNHD